MIAVVTTAHVPAEPLACDGTLTAAVTAGP